MTALTVRRAVPNEKQFHNNTVTLAPIVSAPHPLVGNSCQIKMFIKEKPVNVLVDTGSPTSFIRADIADNLKLTRSTAPPFRFRGVVSSESSYTNESTEILLELDDIKIKTPVYITDAITFEIIIGHPIISSHPLLHKILNNKKPVPEYIVSVLTENDTEELDAENAAAVFAIKISETDTDDRFDKLPRWLKEKYSATVRDDLPPKKFAEPPKVEHEIEIKPGARLPRRQPYQTTPKIEQEINLIVADLLEKKFIVPSKSPCSSPVVLVKKKDGTYRLCVDYRALNTVTIKDPFPLPRIDNLLAKIGSSTIFSTLDLHSGYHQIPMKMDDRFKTAFVTPNGKYEYTVMPFGLVNAPSTFARYMADLFRDLPYVCVYLDDILIHSRSVDEHWKHIDIVLQRLTQEGLIVKKKKCNFAAKSVEFLGYTISANKIQPLISKCAAIEQFPTPRTIKEAQRFLGMINYYRRFIPRCSHIQQPIQDYIHGKSKWSTDQDESFNTLKSHLISNPILVSFKHDGHYRLTTDASKNGLGAVLEEVNEQGKILGVVGYFSKTLQGAQKNYSAGDLELLAIVEALSHFKYMLHGMHFILRTDHISLLTAQKNKEPSRRVIKWLNELAEYDFKLEYLAGPKNVVADAISRADYNIAAIEDAAVTLDPKNWYEEYLADPLCAACFVYITKLDTKDLPICNSSLFKKYMKKLNLSRTFRHCFTINDNIIYFKERYVVPNAKRNEVLRIYHDHGLYGGHFGSTVTYNKIASRYYWPKLHHSVNEYVSSCIQCQLIKSHRPNRQGLLMPSEVPEGRWLNISIDFVSGLPKSEQGNDMIMVVVDMFSKRTHLIAGSYPFDTTSVINALFRYIFAYHGFPYSITSDRDPRFTSTEYQEMAKRLNIKLKMSTANHPQTDGQTERTIQILNRLLKTYTGNNHRQWDRLLPHIEFVYNSTPNRVTKTAPFEVDIGYIPNEPIIVTGDAVSSRHDSTQELATKLKALTLRTKDFLTENQINMEVTHNKGRKEVTFEIGDFVLLHRDAYFKRGQYLKLQPIYVGPFKVVKKINDNAYELDLPSMKKTHRVINVEKLKPLKRRKDRYPKDPPNTAAERKLRVHEIINVVGYDKDNKVFYCHMEDVDPTITVEYPVEEFNLLPTNIGQSLIDNFVQLWKQGSQEREEDVVE